MLKYQTLLTTGGLLLSLSASAFAQTWTKTGNPGNLPATAQVVSGAGPLTSITGSLTFTTITNERNSVFISNPDMYQVFVDGGGTFSASTVGTDGTLWDSTLFLFDSAGKGLLFNDDDPNAAFGARSTLPLTSAPLTPGVYYLAVGTFGARPYSGSTTSYIFPGPTSTGDFSGVFGPTGSGGAGAITGWNLTANDVETGSYTIALTGASFVPAPEPSAWLVLVLGTGGIAVRGLARRRARTKAA